MCTLRECLCFSSVLDGCCYAFCPLQQLPARRRTRSAASRETRQAEATSRPTKPQRPSKPGKKLRKSGPQRGKQTTTVESNQEQEMKVPEIELKSKTEQRDSGTNNSSWTKSIRNSDIFFLYTHDNIHYYYNINISV